MAEVNPCGICGGQGGYELTEHESKKFWRAAECPDCGVLPWTSRARGPVIDFAQRMEKELKLNDHKGGWAKEPIGWLMDRLLDEVVELREAVFHKKGEDIQKEAADVANFAMMLHDVAIRGEATVTENVPLTPVIAGPCAVCKAPATLQVLYKTSAGEIVDQELLCTEHQQPSESRLTREPAKRVEQVGRNEPCPCGSQKKFKKCCGG